MALDCAINNPIPDPSDQQGIEAESTPARNKFALKTNLAVRSTKFCQTIFDGIEIRKGLGGGVVRRGSSPSMRSLTGLAGTEDIFIAGTPGHVWEADGWVQQLDVVFTGTFNFGAMKGTETQLVSAKLNPAIGEGHV